MPDPLTARTPQPSQPPAPPSPAAAAPSGDADPAAPPPPGVRQREIIREQHRLITARVQAEHTAQREAGRANHQADQEFQETTERLTRERDEALKAADDQYDAAIRAIAEAFESSRGEAKREAETIRAKIGGELEVEERNASRALKEKIWAAETIYEANQGKPEAEFVLTKKQIEKKLNDLVATETLASTLLSEYGQPIGPNDLIPPAADPDRAPPADSAAEFDRRAEQAVMLVTRLDRATLPRMVRGGSLYVFAILFVASMSILAAWSQQWKFDAIVIAAVVASIVFAATAVWALSRTAKTHVRKIREPLIQELVAARQSAERWLAVAGARRDAHARSLAEARDDEVLRAKEKHEPVIMDVKRRRTEETARLQERYATKRSAIDHTREQNSTAAADARRGAVAEATARYESATAAASAAVQAAHDASASRQAERFASLESEWKTGDARLHDAVAQLWSEVRDSFRPWSDPAWDAWTPSTAHASHLAFGEFQLDRSAIPGGEPADPRLQLSTASLLHVPASLALPDQCSVLLKYPGVEDAGRAVALRTLQSIMMRILTSLPPGKARFIIFDPVGLGENFAGFMHLADHDEALIGGKIWTEPRHFEQRLTDLTEHMENVIQKYLRNEFRTIAQYNEQAGEIAEPYRFLVIADFPAGFNEASFSRLASVANSGARCGVHTLISLDTRHALPPGAALADIEKNSVRLTWRPPPRPAAPAAAPAAVAAPAPPTPARKLGSFTPGASSAAHTPAPVAPPVEVLPPLPPRMVWEDPDLAPVPLVLDDPPGEDLFNRIINDVGAAAKRSSRVQVPFSTIAPAPEEYWSQDSGEELRVPLGRAGATKLQYLTLGRGTSQHALIAGKTGSGKSTLLNTIVTNLSMWYSPDQVQFYLIDFKKGVEFKSYATHELAHARAVAIESDREFGLSVLQRLDSELKRRGNLFRDLGVQDLRGFRAKQPGVAMPRLLLIIDEFQEFFTEDDKLSQDATLLLDRLVRQGRAFGMHVILGSQTLSGAYSLARSTMGQMAVRVALQCSEADSYVILSEDNAAARLLSRPGEAIYNDASGLIEGNSPFQIAWLPDDAREAYLSRVAELSRERKYKLTERQAVFEGNIPADLARNLPLMNLLEAAATGGAAGNTSDDASGSPTLRVGTSDAAGETTGSAARREGSSASFSAPAASAPNALKVWVGDAIAIKDPTAAVLRRQAGSNIMIVGQRDETAAALLAAAMIGLSAQLPPRSPSRSTRHAESAAFTDPGHQDIRTQDRISPPSASPTFYLLDPTPPDSHLFGVLESVASKLPNGHAARVVAMKSVPEALAELTAELKRRQEEPGDEGKVPGAGFRVPPEDEDAALSPDTGPHDSRTQDRISPPPHPSLFLLIHGIQKYRSLRRPEDDFSFSMDGDKAPSPDKQLAELLREGPTVGIHVILWCDTAPNLTRALDRQGLREFDYRVLMQMSQADSATLIDSPEAGKLGLHRALLHSEEQGYSEKFRPYAMVREGWEKQHQ